MIRLNGVRVAIGPRVLFEDVNWVIAPGDRCALVGPNGAGKTTLIRVALGDQQPEAGIRTVSRDSRVGYLPQEAAERFDGTVLDRALAGFSELFAMEREQTEIHERLSGVSPQDPDLEGLLHRAGEIQHALEHRDVHALEPRARRILSGLGFTTGDQDRPLASFSGGWRMRAALAALLMQDPTALFLDEPTNHLDLPAMEWLEEYLGGFEGALVVVSHDRVFLDRVAGEVRELDSGRLNTYAMGFTAYLDEKEERRGRMESENLQTAKKIAQLQRFVDRFGAKNTKATQAASKKKQIERLAAGRHVVPRRAKGIHFTFPPPPRPGRVLVRASGAAFGYDERDVFRDAEVTVERGDKVAIVGANGAGKTTLLRMLAGQLPPRAGEREEGDLTRSAYFAQHAAETLDPRDTVLETLDREASEAWRPKLRGLLGSFLFTGDDVFKPCGVLSGGERQRVALCRMLLQPANLLLLDEPTHHLDLGGKEVLEEALVQFAGAVVVVTHDRSLMTRVATRVVEVSGGRVTVYPGGYDEYEEARARRAAAEAGAAEPPSEASEPEGADPEAAREAGRRNRNAGKREERRRDAERRRREEALAGLEAEIRAAEGEVAGLEARLADPGLYADGGPEAADLVREYEARKAELDALWRRMEEP